MKMTPVSCMKTLLAAVVTTTILIASPAFAEDTGDEIPAVLSYLEKDGTASHSDFPDWVSAKRAVTPSGELDATVLSPSVRAVIARYLEGGPTSGDCIDVIASDDHMVRKGRPGYRTDLATAIRTSDWVFKARVLAREPGFQGSTPGTLVQVLPETTFKGSSRPPTSAYFFVPVGEVPIGEQKICIRNPDYAALPDVGDEVVLLIDLSWQKPGPFLRPGNETGLITLRKQGDISLPKPYRSEEKALHGKTSADFLRFVAESAREAQ